jgi:hypothetical protein
MRKAGVLVLVVVLILVGVVCALGSYVVGEYNNLVKLSTDCEAFTTDLKYYMVKEILAGNKPKFAKMMQNANVIKMAVK